MSDIESLQAYAGQLAEAAAQAKDSAGKQHEYINGSATEDVLTESGLVPTIAKQVVLGQAKVTAALEEVASQLSGAMTYKTTEKGILSTQPGALFGVLSPNNKEYVVIYENVANVAVSTGKSYPSAEIVAPVVATQLSTESETISYGLASGDISLPTNAYTRALGYAVPYACTAVGMTIVTAASAVGEVHVYRHNGAARGQHTLDLIIAVSLPLAGANKIMLPDIKLEVGDIVAYAAKSGGYLKGDTTSQLSGILIDPAPLSVGQGAIIGGVVKPAIELTLVKSNKVNSFEGRIFKVESGVGTALDSTYATFGSVAAGTTAPSSPVTTYSFGAKEAVPARSLLNSIRHKTTSLNSMVHYLVIIFRLQSGTSFLVSQTIPVSVMTDPSGIATAGANELGRVVLEKGDRVHVYASNTLSAPVLYADNGARGSFLNKSSFTVGETVAAPGAYLQTVALDFTVELLATQALDSRLVVAETNVGDIKHSLGLAVSTQGTLDGPSTWATFDRSFGYVIKAAGRLSRFSVNVSAAGQGELHVYRKLTSGGFVVASITPLELFTAGVNAFEVGLRVELGDIVAYAPVAGALARYTADASAEVGVYVAPRPTVIGSKFINTVATRGAVQLVISSSASLDETNQRVAALESATPVSSVVLKYSTPLLREMFPGSELPSGWTEAGGWTVNNGLASPEIGGWGCFALSPGYASLIKRQICAKIRVDDAASVFGLCTFPPKSSGGAVALVDGAAKKLRLYSWTGTAVAGTYSSEVAIPFSLVAGRSYMLEAYKDGLKSTIRLTDMVSQATCEISEEHNAAYRQWHGRAGVMFHSGAIKVDWFNVNGGYPKTLRSLIVGDSICEGMYLPFSSPSWAYQVANVRSAEGDFAIAPRAGDETPTFMGRKAYDLDPWKSQYVVLALGTNDGSQAVWRTNMASLIAQVVAAGGEPILCTQVPRTASQSVRTAMNEDIRSGYFGRFRYIDFAVCVSLNNDGITWNPAYDYGDHIHPNAAGHAKMFAQAMLDAPFLVR